MKLKNLTYKIAVVVILLTIGGCSTKKNTATRRFYHNYTTRFNVYFNGNEYFKSGYKKIENGYQPDYSHIIDMFAVSSPSTNGLGKTDMNSSVEKCRKAIKEHSIRKKPKKNSSKTRDPKYMEFYNKEEFNTMMYKVWLMLGQSQYYANDYLAASATFTYITKHFPENKKLVTKAQIWKAKALKEMDWTYEAENILANLPDDDFDEKIDALYSSAYADLKIKQGEWAEALPYLDKAIELAPKRKLRTRFRFVEAQIYQKLGQKEKAYELYEQVIKASPDYQMGFNARINQTEVYGGQNDEKMIKSLHKMAKKANNKDYLDQIYYAIGNIYLNKQDTATAIENYKISVEKSTRNGIDKAQSLITMGDIYYVQGKYIEASPCFGDAAQLIDQTHPDYDRVNNLAQVLGELAQKHETVVLQDSLQALSKMSKSEQLAAANRAIDKIKQREKEEQERLVKQQEQNRMLDLEIENMAVMNKQALGGKQTADWYFYNANTVSKGKIEFQRKFGNRRLEDNWNRQDKAFIARMDLDKDEENGEQGDAEKGDANETSADSVKSPTKEINNKNPEYYLRQIPQTEEQIAASNEQIASALYDMGVIYNDKLDDRPKAKETFDELIRRFGTYGRRPDAIFNCYRMSEKDNNTIDAENYKKMLVDEYPDSKYAKILSQPDFRKQIEQMQKEQDSIYYFAYKNYNNSEFDKVMETADQMEKKYPVSPLIPKFMLLKALSAGKKGDIDSLSHTLDKILAKYPNSDVATMAKDISALMKQGQIPSQGSSSQLASKRERILNDSVQGEPTLKTFRLNEKTPYLYYLITDPKEVRENWLLYYTASFNFTKFLVKDYDLRIKDGTLVVSGLDNLEEALLYTDGISKDKEMNKLLEGKKHRSLVISVENSELIGRGFTIEDYEKFYQDSIVNRKKRRVSTKIELVGDQKELDKMANENDKKDFKAGDRLDGQPAAVEEKKTEKDSKQNENSADTPSAEKKISKDPDIKENKAEKTETAEVRKKQTVVAKPWKEGLKKYKGLYTYDPSADHKFVLLLTKANANLGKVKEALNKYNNEKMPLLNLNVDETSGTGFPQIIEVGLFPDAKTAKAYLLQLSKDDAMRDILNDMPHRRIVISTQNLEALKQSGNINVYMEVFRRLYLGR